MRSPRWVASAIVAATLASGTADGSIAGVLAGDVGAGASNSSTGLQARPAKASPVPADRDTSVADLGVHEGEAFQAGLVFHDGRYVPGPYRVSRTGRWVTVNGAVVYAWKVWPLPDLLVPEDPGLPQGLTEKSTFEELIGSGDRVNSHVARKYRYLYQHFPAPVAFQKMLEFYRQLPFVEQADVVRSTTIRLRTKDGKTTDVSVRPPAPKSMSSWDLTAADVLQELKCRRLHCETRLRAGDCFFLFSSGAYPLSWGRRQTARDLGLVVEILRSDRTKEEKTHLLQRMEVLPPPATGGADRYSALVTGFQAPPELDEYIRNLVAETGITPRRLKNIPDEIPFERILRLEKEAKKRANQPQK